VDSPVPFRQSDVDLVPKRLAASRALNRHTLRERCERFIERLARRMLNTGVAEDVICRAKRLSHDGQ
jgi:hypothetical protein